MLDHEVVMNWETLCNKIKEM